MDDIRISRLKDRYQAETWSSGTEPYDVRAELDLESALLPGWSVLDVATESREDGPESQTLLLRGADEEREEILKIEIHRYPDAQAARDGLLALLDQFEGPVVERLESGEAPGEAAFSVPGGYLTLFVQGNAVVRVSNAGRDLVPTAQQALSVSTALGR